MLVLSRKGGDYWATVLSRPYRHTASTEFFGRDDLGTWKLSFGLTSFAGLAYWGFALALVAVARRRSRAHL